MNTIIVELDTFSFESRATIYKDNKECERISVRSNIKDMANQITKFAYDNDIYNVRFHGPALLRDEFEVNIRDVERNLYSENKITV